MKIIIIILSLSSIVFAQPFESKQITYFNFDCKKPTFFKYAYNIPDWDNRGDLIFEAHSGDSINIYVMNYNASADTFENAVPITQNKYKNRNPDGISYYDNFKVNHMVIWETNEKGNWDIAYSINSGDGWSEPGYLVDSEAEENKPVFIKEIGWPYHFAFLFEKEGSIYLYTRKADSSNISVVFQSTGGSKYSQATGIFNWTTIDIAAMRDDGIRQSLVYTENFVPGAPPADPQPVYGLYPVQNPKFLDLFYYYYPPGIISFEIEVDGKYRTVLLDKQDFGLNTGEFFIDDDPSIESINYNSFVIGIVTEEPVIDPWVPSVYQIKRNDSAYVVVTNALDLFYFYYKEYHTKVASPNVNIGPVGFTSSYYLISYSVWEDSTGGNINIFGLKRLDTLGDVSEESVINNFLLFQNYPNPFNPSTSIEYRVVSREYVTLKVYDVLGREVATLINEEKQPGVYEVEFSASNLASGIYYYQLKSGSFVETKKMMVLK